MAHARKDQSGPATGIHVGSRTNVGTGGAYTDIVNSSTSNFLRCQYCNSATWAIKATHYVDRDETHPAVLHSGNESGATADCLICMCAICGREHTFDVDTTTDWTDQGA